MGADEPEQATDPHHCSAPLLRYSEIWNGTLKIRSSKMHLFIKAGRSSGVSLCKQVVEGSGSMDTSLQNLTMK